MRRGRLAALSLVAVVVASSCAAGWLAVQLLHRGPERVVVVHVAPGASGVEVLERLRREELVPSPLAARIWLAWHGEEGGFRWGDYRFPPGTRPVEVLERLVAGEVDTVRVTVVEGWTAAEISSAMIEAGVGTASGWAASVDRTKWVAELAPEADTLEGYLFPDTYRFALGVDAATAARHMVDRFVEVWEGLGVGDPWGTPHQIVTLASLVEAETSVPKERARVAGVFVNRLERGMLLQCDPTVAYALERQGLWTGRLLRLHWQIDHPYNTYRYPGLPPGPINSPGAAAMAAALAPEDHDYLYFVARPGGGHQFSHTLKEHAAAVARLDRSRR